MEYASKLKFGFYKEPNYNGWTEKVLTFKNNNRQEFHNDYRHQVDVLLATGVFDLQILSVAD